MCPPLENLTPEVSHAERHSAITGRMETSLSRRNLLAGRAARTALGTSAWSGDSRRPSTAARNAAHSAREKIRTGPGRLESRTATRPAGSLRDFHAVTAGVAVTALSPCAAAQLQGVRAPVSTRSTVHPFLPFPPEPGLNEPHQALLRDPPHMTPPVARRPVQVHLHLHIRSGIVADALTDGGRAQHQARWSIHVPGTSGGFRASRGPTLWLQAADGTNVHADRDDRRQRRIALAPVPESAKAAREFTSPRCASGIWTR